MLRPAWKGLLDMTGIQIKELRKSLGYTQARLAEEVGLTPNTIARYERDELKPSPPVLKLLRLLELSQELNKAGRRAA
jgi:putative transcriptional regulator